MPGDGHRPGLVDSPNGAGSSDASGAGDGPGEPGSDDELLLPDPSAAKPRSGLRTAIEWALVIGGALLVAVLVRTFFIQAFWIPSDSMEPTLHKGDRVLVNKLSYRFNDVGRGDIVVFKRPEAAQSNNPDDDIEDLIKRVIGLPGDVLKTVDGQVYINDEPLDEPYLPEGTPTLSPSGQDVPPITIPEGHYFMMGDNRTNSQDSRYFGAIDEDLIVGRAFVRIYPLGDIGGL
ncbi:MAG TPA: signal peptidase I [Acidimicrobiales bacterium]